MTGNPHGAPAPTPPDAHAAFDLLFKANLSVKRLALDEATPQPIKAAAIAAACLSERAVVELFTALMPFAQPAPPADMRHAS